MQRVLTKSNQPKQVTTNKFLGSTENLCMNRVFIHVNVLQLQKQNAMLKIMLGTEMMSL